MIDGRTEIKVVDCKLVNLRQNKECSCEADRTEICTTPWANVLYELCRRNLHKVAVSTFHCYSKFA